MLNHVLNRSLFIIFSVVSLTACHSEINPIDKPAHVTPKPAFKSMQLGKFDEPWAMAVLPENTFTNKTLLITQKTGELFLFDTVTGKKTLVTGVPDVAYGGQGGLGDVIVAPDFATSKHIYLSYVEAGDSDNRNNTQNDTRGAKVIRAQLANDNAKMMLKNIKTIWTQTPKTTGHGHYSHRLLISPDNHLFISSGDRQKLTPAQDMNSSLGKIIRVHLDGSIPKDNPFADQATPANAFWSLGHRNGLGMRFDAEGRLWEIEMGPRNGDELNLIQPKKNYGWPLVSEGRHYDGRDIPDHNTRPEFEAPKVAWTPVISPASIAIYSGQSFPAWQGKALISGLSSKSLVVVDLGTENKPASEIYRYKIGSRLRNVTTDGDAVYLIEDGNNARLWQLLPK